MVTREKSSVLLAMEHRELVVELDRRPAGRQGEHERGVGFNGGCNVGGERPGGGTRRREDAGSHREFS